MTTKKFANQIEKQCKTILNVSLEPIFNEYIVERNGKRIGVLFDNKLYLLSTKNLKRMFPNAIEENPFGWAYYRLIHIENTEDIEHLTQAIMTSYDDLYFQKEFVCDISSLIEAYSTYPDVILDTYNLHITFLRFCYEKKLIKVNPLDKCDRIIRMNYTNNNLTEKGTKILNDLYDDWLNYTNKTDEKSEERNKNVKMLEKYYLKILQKKGINE